MFRETGFFAKIFLMNLCAIYAPPIEEKVRKEYSQANGYKNEQKINSTSAIAIMQEILVPIFLKNQLKNQF
jgi:hypothetical protein